MDQKNNINKDSLSIKTFKVAFSFIFVFGVPPFIIMILWNYFPFIFLNNKNILVFSLLVALIFSWLLVIYKYKKLKSLYEEKKK
ncbi:hypothetical protein K9L04_01355 [Patescibacteria group bacterium]|nr:hypothetical protein [Patescibacteria group bacterium]